MLRSLLLLVAAGALAGCVATDSSSASRAATPAPARLAYDFNAANPWPAAAPLVSGRVRAQVDWAAVGSHDTAGSADASRALRLVADASGLRSGWRATLRSGPLPVSLPETDLAKLTLAFDLSASAARPVQVTIASLDARGRHTGSLQGTVYPAAPDFIHRHVLDLDKLQPVGTGKFSPRAAAIELAFSIEDDTWPAARHEVRVDNVSLAGPAFYVSPRGSDSADGRTAATAFATPQRAIQAAQAGDIILLGEGTYDGGLRPVASFVRPGSPAAWIVLKNHPGQKPVITGTAWNLINFSFGTKDEPNTTDELAYLEVRGLHVRGISDRLQELHPDAIGKSDGRSNSNGIAVDGRHMAKVPHHLRFADNLVEHMPGQGIGAIEADWFVFENNISRYNCRWTIYATSGFSTLGASNFDRAENIYKILIRDNVSHRNETTQQWAAVKRISDGNGFIVDLNFNSPTRPGSTYLGRTLVINNLAYDNGGSGIHAVQSAKVDILHNTAYLNSASPALQYSQIYTYGCKDVRIMNNILVAPVANTAAGEKPEPVNRLGGRNTNVVFSHNLYFGGNVPPALGEGDQIGDPRFVHASIDPAVADFRLRPDSPALDAATSSAPALPWFDLDRRVRPQGKAYDLGTYERAVKN